MGSHGEYSHGSSRTQQTIQRSKFPKFSIHLYAITSANIPPRVLLATIRGMKSFQPCPRCLVPKAEFPNLGVPEDWRQRRELKRVDTQARNDLVAQARSIIFTNGRAVTYKGVEQLLKPQSYVPTEVRQALVHFTHICCCRLISSIY